KHCCGYCQTECFQGFLVNDETEVGWLLEWEIGGGGPSLDSIRKGRRARRGFPPLWTQTHQPAAADQGIIFLKHRQLVFGGELKDPLAVERSQGIRNHEDGIGTVAHHRSERGSEVLRLAHAKRLYFETQRPRRRFRIFVASGHPKIVCVP